MNATVVSQDLTCQILDLVKLAQLNAKHVCLRLDVLAVLRDTLVNKMQFQLLEEWNVLSATLHVLPASTLLTTVQAVLKDSISLDGNALRNSDSHLL